MAKNDRRVEVYCLTCGRVELSNENYLWQLDQPHRAWSCPKCYRDAIWGGIWHRCLVEGCEGWADEDSDTCDVCGQVQRELWEDQIPDA